MTVNDCERSWGERLPWLEHSAFCQLMCDGRGVQPEILPEAGGAFFKSDPDGRWTCYRRNYVNVRVRYVLHGIRAGEVLYVFIEGKQRRVRDLGTRITAHKSGTSEDSIDLVHFTPKREHGLQLADKVISLSTVASRTAISPTLQLCKQFRDGFGEGFVFERMQFRSATPNNGSRSSRQPGNRLCTELLADVSAEGADVPEWRLICRRISEDIVVRGRSPVHYRRKRAYDHIVRANRPATVGRQVDHAEMQLAGPFRQWD